MSFAVERLEQEDPQFSEDSSAYTEAYALVDITFGAGAVFGPLISGLLYEKTTWAITYGVLAAFCFSGSIPVVSALWDLQTHWRKRKCTDDPCRCCTQVAYGPKNNARPMAKVYGLATRFSYKLDSPSTVRWLQVSNVDVAGVFD